MAAATQDDPGRPISSIEVSLMLDSTMRVWEAAMACFARRTANC